MFICFRSTKDGGAVSYNTIPDVTLKFDTAWQKRGSGRSYSSKSGVGTLMGNNTGKIVDYGIRLSDCSTCSRQQGGGDVPVHVCNKNWGGSAKAMEPDIGIKLMKAVEEKGVRVSTLIMDDDTTTMEVVRPQCGKVE